VTQHLGSAPLDAQVQPLGAELDALDVHLDVVRQPRGDADGAVREVRFEAESESQ
jgi:hypothetical protein